MNNEKKIAIIKSKILNRIIIFLGGKMISLILAAGKGTRMKSEKSKDLTEQMKTLVTATTRTGNMTNWQRF